MPGRQWTPEQRQRQRELIREWQPWTKSTGPVSAEGKRESSYNALKHGRRSAPFRRAQEMLALYRRAERELLHKNNEK